MDNCNCCAGAKAIVGDITGLNSLFHILSRNEFSKESEDSIQKYVGPTEKVMFYLKSGTKKLVFTNLAMIYFRFLFLS
jgi:hypothetical protein